MIDPAPEAEPKKKSKKDKKKSKSSVESQGTVEPPLSPSKDEKKKKRKFGLKAAPAFQWDPIEGVRLLSALNRTLRPAHGCRVVVCSMTALIKR